MRTKERQAYLGCRKARCGPLVAAEYREDLKRAISVPASALQPFDDNGHGFAVRRQPRRVRGDTYPRRT